MSTPPDERATGPSGDVPPITTAAELREMLSTLADHADAEATRRAYDRAERFAAALEVREPERRPLTFQLLGSVALVAYVGGVWIATSVGFDAALGLFVIVGALAVVYRSVLA